MLDYHPGSHAYHITHGFVKGLPLTNNGQRGIEAVTLKRQQCWITNLVILFLLNKGHANRIRDVFHCIPAVAVLGDCR